MTFLERWILPKGTCVQLRQMILFTFTVLIFSSRMGQVAGEDQMVYVMHPIQEVTPKGSPTPLRCYECSSNSHSNHDCILMGNVTNVGVKACPKSQEFCKVRSLMRYGELVVFDRFCNSECTPGYNKAASYEENIACCTSDLCNIHDVSSGSPWQRHNNMAVMTSLVAAVLWCNRMELLL